MKMMMRKMKWSVEKSEDGHVEGDGVAEDDDKDDRADVVEDEVEVDDVEDDDGGGAR